MMNKVKEALRLFRQTLIDAAQRPSFWTSLFIRTVVLGLSLSFLTKWAYRDEHWTFLQAVAFVTLRPTFPLVAIAFGCLGRAMDDSNQQPLEIVRVFANQIFVPSKPVGIWTVICAVLFGIGNYGGAELIALGTCVAYFNRIISCETSKVLECLPGKKSKREFAVFTGEFPPQTR